MSLNAIKFLKSNLLTSVPERKDQISIVVREDDISNGHILVKLLRLSGAPLDVSIVFSLASFDFFLHCRLNLVHHGALERKSGCISLLPLTTALFVCAGVPDVVSGGWDFELNTVVTGSHSGQVPLELCDLTTLVQGLQNEHEQETDSRGSSTGEAHEIVLGGKLSLVLNASVLNKEIIRLVVAQIIKAASIHVACGELNIERLLADSLSEL